MNFICFHCDDPNPTPTPMDRLKDKNRKLTIAMDDALEKEQYASCAMIKKALEIVRDKIETLTINILVYGTANP